MTTPLHLGVALDGYGWHPDARHQAPDPPPVTSGRYWAGLAATAERGLLDFLTVDDSLRPTETPRADAVLIAARVAPATRHIGLVPVATVTHTEPFHVSKAIATLDHVSGGRAGWQPRVSVTAREAALFGRRIVDHADLDALFDEATDVVEVVRRLWDSWEDDAEIRDVATGRFVDRDKLHYVDFVGAHFSVKGPSITPRPPQGQPVVAALAHAPRIYEFAARTSDLVFVTPADDPSLRAILDQVDVGLKVYADIVVAMSGDSDFDSDAMVFGGSADDLVDLIRHWQALGVHGFRLRPAVNATDLPAIVDAVVPRLQRAGRFRAAYREGETLRARLGLPVAVNRYQGVKQP